jgi:hypothetical protein
MEVVIEFGVGVVFDCASFGEGLADTMG